MPVRVLLTVPRGPVLLRTPPLVRLILLHTGFTLGHGRPGNLLALNLVMVVTTGLLRVVSSELPYVGGCGLVVNRSLTNLAPRAVLRKVRVAAVPRESRSRQKFRVLMTGTDGSLELLYAGRFLVSNGMLLFLVLLIMAPPYGLAT